VAGIYPILADGSCKLVAADFDGEHWAVDALAFFETCHLRGVPAALERSRSGEGGHVWVFFSRPIPARDARQLGAVLITETMERRPEVGFKSYDRLFPSQDNVPKGGFGNLIALPLQRRARDYGNSVFVDRHLHAYRDQWAFLANLRPMTPEEVYSIVGKAAANDRVLAVKMPIADENGDDPWNQSAFQRQSLPPITEPLPDRVKMILADDVYVDRTALPSTMVARLIRLAAFQNPEFYQAQAMRRSTYDKPRIISCAVLHQKHVALPRGCLDDLLILLGGHRVEADVEDLRERGTELECRFLGTLRPEQQAAVAALSQHDSGVLAATTAFGKTVVAADLIAHRRTSTLILVHRKELLKQWAERLQQFLSLSPQSIGTIGGGRRKPTGRIDIALPQSLSLKGKGSDPLVGYGQIVVDECHHLSATSFESVARRSKAHYWLGLSATVARKDGHQPIIFMQCGPIRHRVDPRSQALRRGFLHKVRIRDTTFTLPAELEDAPLSMPAIYSAIGRLRGTQLSDL
jgi:hypothetical protein